MKRFRFPLEAALRLQKRRLKWVESQVRLAFREVRKAEDEIERCRNAMRHLAAEFASAAANGQLPPLWSAYPRNADRIERERIAGEGRLVTAQEAFRRVDEERRSIVRNCEALSQLRAQAWEEHRAEAERHAQIAADEHVIRGWQEESADASSAASEGQS